MKSAAFTQKAANAFTLVELLAVIAIIAILGAVALPAYNNYSLKSKFSEVVLATSPIKSFVSTCAATGDCVSGNAIVLSTAGSFVAGQGVPAPNTFTPAQVALYQLIYPFEVAYNGGAAAGSSYTAGDTITMYNRNLYTVGVDPTNPNNMCALLSSGSCAILTSLSGNNTSSMPISTIQYYAGASSPASLSGAGAAPCIGSSAGCSPATKYALAASASASGVITAVAQSSSGLQGETFVLTPSYSGGRVDWSASGTCKTRAGGALC